MNKRDWIMVALFATLFSASFLAGAKLSSKKEIIICGGCTKAITQMNERVMIWNRLIDSGNVIFICTDNKELGLPSYKREIRVLNAK